MSFLIANTQLTQVVLRNCNLTDEVCFTFTVRGLFSLMYRKQVLKLLLGPLLSLRNLRFLSLASNSDLTENAIKYVTVFLKRVTILLHFFQPQ